VDLPEHGVITKGRTSEMLTYNPSSGFTGNDIFTYKATDGLGQESNKAKVTVDIHPQSDIKVTWNERGEVLVQQNKFREAIECYDKSLEINPNDIQTLKDKAYSLAQLGNHKEALECLDEVIRIYPNDVEAWTNKGLELCQLSRYDEGIESFDKALAINPSYQKAIDNKNTYFRYKRSIEVSKNTLESGTPIGVHFSSLQIQKTQGGQEKQDTHHPSSKIEEDFSSNQTADETTRRGGPLGNQTADEAMDWNKLFGKNVRCKSMEDIGSVIGTTGEDITVAGYKRRIYKVPKSDVEGFNGSEVSLSISLRQMIYYDSAFWSNKSRKYYGQKIDLGMLSRSTQEFLVQNEFKTKFFDDSTNTELRFYIHAIKSGKLRTMTGTVVLEDIIVRGTPDDFAVTITTPERGYGVSTQGVTGSVTSVSGPILGEEQKIWAYIEWTIKNQRL
jgi:Tetratricopeptide repeat